MASTLFGFHFLVYFAPHGLFKLGLLGDFAFCINVHDYVIGVVEIDVVVRAAIEQNLPDKFAAVDNYIAVVCFAQCSAVVVEQFFVAQPGKVPTFLGHL